MGKPKVKSLIDISDIEKSCRDFVDFIDSEDFNEGQVEDYTHRIFEKAFESFYGQKGFDFLNSKL